MLESTLKVALFGKIDALSVGLIVFPHPNILLSFTIVPETVTLHGSILKISNIRFRVKGEYSVAVRLIVSEIALIG